MSRLRIYQDRNKEWRWTLFAKNGKKLANGGESYKRRRDLLKIVAMLFPWFRVRTKTLERAVNTATQETYWELS